MYKISSPTILPLPSLRYRMDYRELRRLSRQFWHQHRPTWCFVRDYDPGLWVHAHEILEAAHRLRWTQEGAVVREFPEMRDVAAQVQTRRVHERGTQTSPTRGRDVGTQARDDTRDASLVRATPTLGGCWNCGSFQHSYANCSRPRRDPFCFGCGERDVTVRTCRRCGPVYERTRPYTAPRGPRDRL